MFKLQVQASSTDEPDICPSLVRVSLSSPILLCPPPQAPCSMRYVVSMLTWKLCLAKILTLGYNKKPPLMFGMVGINLGPYAPFPRNSLLHSNHILRFRITDGNTQNDETWYKPIPLRMFP